MPTAGLSTSEQSLRARIAVNESWARTDDRRARTQAARDARFQRFEDQVDPEGKLDPEERRRRAEHAQRAYMQRLALRSAQARRARRGTVAP